MVVCQNKGQIQNPRQKIHTFRTSFFEFFRFRYFWHSTARPNVHAGAKMQTKTGRIEFQSSPLSGIWFWWAKYQMKAGNISFLNWCINFCPICSVSYFKKLLFKTCSFTVLSCGFPGNHWWLLSMRAENNSSESSVNKPSADIWFANAQCIRSIAMHEL